MVSIVFYTRWRYYSAFKSDNLFNERRSQSASLDCDVFSSHVGPLFLIFICGYIVHLLLDSRFIRM